MTLKIDLPPELEREVDAAAASEGRNPEEFVRALVLERLGASHKADEGEDLAAMLDRWEMEDQAGHPAGPLPSITPFSLRPGSRE